MFGRREFLLAGAAVAVPHLPVTGRSVIRIHLNGGASQVDTFDPKPGGPFRPINSTVSGIQVSELFPLLARQTHRIALVRSVYSGSVPVHEFGEAGAVTSSFFRAARLVEAGEKLVTLNMFRSLTDGPSWDTHGWGPFSTLADLRDVVAPAFDRKFTALLEDLQRHRLLEFTTIVVSGEFGRAPRLNPQGGRDHWPHCWTALLAGAGIRGGVVYGSSDAEGAEPRENPVTFDRVAATAGLPGHGLPIAELLA